MNIIAEYYVMRLLGTRLYLADDQGGTVSAIKNAEMLNSKEDAIAYIQYCGLSVNSFRITRILICSPVIEEIS